MNDSQVPGHGSDGSGQSEADEKNDLTSTGRRSLLSVIGLGAIGLASTSSSPMSSGTARQVLPSNKSRIIIHHAEGARSVMEKSLSRAGAVGDGKTIDTGAIQDAIAEVERNTRFEVFGSNTPFDGAGELIWPQGLYLIDDTIRISRSLRLRGEGQAEYSSGARIQQQRPNRDIFRIEPIAQGCSVGFNNLVLRANGGGGSDGALIRIIKGQGSCNSIRFIEVVFGTPQQYAIDIESGDDVIISRCLFDVSATRCIRMGIKALFSMRNLSS